MIKYFNFIFYILFIFFIFICFGKSIFAQESYFIHDIFIKGNNTISNDEIIKYLSINKEIKIEAEKLINIEEKLLNWGYFSYVSINFEIYADNKNISENDSNNEKSHENNNEEKDIKIDIFINLTENIPVKSIIIKNMNINLLKIKNKIMLKENKAFNPKYLEKDLEYLSKQAFVSRVSSKLIENKDSIDVEIYINFSNKLSSEILISEFSSVNFNYFIGKTFIPLYFSIFFFYPFNNQNFSLDFAGSIGFSLLDNLYFNFILNMNYSESNSSFYIDSLLTGFSYKKYSSNLENLIFYTNPLSLFFSYDMEMKEPKKLFFTSDFTLLFKNLFLIFVRSNFSYYFEDYNFIFGNVPYNGQEIDLVVNKTYNIFFYSGIYDSFIFRSTPFQISDQGKIIFSNSFDFVFKIYSTRLFYIGTLISFDSILYYNSDILSRICYGLGLIFSISIKNFIEIPFTIQYFWESDFNSGVFYFTLLSKRFS